MLVYIQYCKNCQGKYRHQASGENVLDTAPEYRDEKYCPSCKKLIVDVLKPVPKKTRIEWILSEDYTLDQLLAEEKKQYEKDKFKVKQIFATLYNMERGEHQRAGSVTIDRKEYHYSYWPSMAETPRITVKVRFDNATGNIIDYR